MEIFRTNHEIATATCEKLCEGAWTAIPQLRTHGGMILTGVSDDEHDKILDIYDKIDQDNLRGFMAKLILEDKQEDDPEYVSLALSPTTGHVIRHFDRYYLVRFVLQSTNFTLAVFVDRITQDQLMSLGRVHVG